jgi:hypothetical protein
MPALGVKYKINKKISPYFEFGSIILTDGPPVGFPKSNEVAGYLFINVGLRYSFST